MALQSLLSIPPDRSEESRQALGCLLCVTDFPGIGINRIDLDADCQFISLAVVDRPTLGNEGNLNMLLLCGQLIELFLLQHLELKHPAHNEHKTEEEETREKEDPDLKPIDRFLFHRITITWSGLGLDIPNSSAANFSIRA